LVLLAGESQEHPLLPPQKQEPSFSPQVVRELPQRNSGIVEAKEDQWASPLQLSEGWQCTV
jgi:hypothetical protein